MVTTFPHLRRLAAGTLLALATAALAAGCTSGQQRPAPQAPGQAPAAGSVLTLTGAGSTFVNPLFSRQFSEYSRTNPGVRVNYLAIGSGGGIRQLIEGTVDFGASDAPLTADEEQKAGGDVLHIPVTLGAVAVAYNVPGVGSGLRVDPAGLVGIFLGDIKKWNDPRLAALNLQVALPDLDITPVYRSDGSGTTFIFTDYLSAVSPDFKAKVGAAKAVRFPVGLGAKGNEGVSGQVSQIPGAVGYMELAYAAQTQMAVLALQNQAGRFVTPTPAGATAAAAGAAGTMPKDLRVSLVNAPGDESYPIAGLTWALLRREQRDAGRGRAVAELLWWVIHDGQRYAADLHYAPLPAAVIAPAEVLLRSAQAQGQPLLVR